MSLSLQPYGPLKGMHTVIYNGASFIKHEIQTDMWLSNCLRFGCQMETNSI